ncbi:MAG TPA: ChbG/HpnK family deacetylase [Candidatus Acidoferrum sp.]|nr:ChbG/HpnK family deacetylase [Candidatus Acidoferrum sp.]HTZ84307.1 ChbG/HpnK family deacetylase [Candidatus Acidoferrales bacterium]
MRRLIVNADDFGFTAGVNRAIVEAHTRGIVTSSTLMAHGKAFDEAVKLAQSTPGLSVGCHVVLIDGAPVLDSTRLPSLTDSDRFRDGLKSFAARALAGRMNAGEITTEATAQIRRIQSAGITVSHLDTHKHTHVFPQILKPVLRAAADCGVRALRNPFGPRRPFRSSQLLARPNLWTRYAEVRILRAFSNKFRDSVSRAGFITPDGTLGIEVTGTLDETLFRAIAENVPEGTWEFVCHPGYNDADLCAANTRLRESRETELHVLTLPSARAMLTRVGIELISYRDLAADSFRP